MDLKKKVYICFDFDQDKSLKDLLVAQCHNENCPFEIIDASLKEAKPEKDWEDKAFERIKRADTVLVMLGHLTYRAPGVLREVKIARSLGKKVVQLIGYKDHKYHRIPGAGIVYSWTWDNLHKLFP